MTIFYETWATLLYRINAVCSPAELHGYACGRLATGQRLSAEQWLAQANEFMDLLEGQIDDDEAAAIEGLYELALTAISDGELGLKLLLPDDELPIAERVNALSAWVTSFLHGLGYGGQNISEKLGEDSRELLHDLASMTQISVEHDASEEQESHFNELAEFVRLGAHTLFFEFNKAPAQEGPNQLH